MSVVQISEHQWVIDDWVRIGPYHAWGQTCLQDSRVPVALALDALAWGKGDIDAVLEVYAWDDVPRWRFERTRDDTETYEVDGWCSFSCIGPRERYGQAVVLGTEVEIRDAGRRMDRALHTGGGAPRRLAKRIGCTVEQLQRAHDFARRTFFWGGHAPRIEDAAVQVTPLE